MLRTEDDRDLLSAIAGRHEDEPVRLSNEVVGTAARSRKAGKKG